MANCSTTGRWIDLPGEWDVNRWNDEFNYLSLTGRLFHYSGQLHIFALRLKRTRHKGAVNSTNRP